MHEEICFVVPIEDLLDTTDGDDCRPTDDRIVVSTNIMAEAPA